MIPRFILGGGLIAAALILDGCAVGPDFSTPAAPAASRYTSEPLPEQTAAAQVGGGAAQRFIADRDIPGQWWALFHSDALNRLIDEALKANSTLQAAQASLRIAQENVYVRQAGFAPVVGAQLQSTRAKIANGISSPLDSGQQLFDLHTAQVTVSYMPDIFGGTRRAVESAQAQEQAQRFQYEATYLSLVSNLVNAAIQEAGLRAQLAATRAFVHTSSDILDLMRNQYGLGAIGYADVLAQQQTVAQAQAQVPALQKQLAQQRDLLAALVGRLPSDPMLETFELDGLDLPTELPVSLPSKLVEQRPDVAAATALLHGATADVGVATANMLPQITLGAAIGSSAAQFGNLFGPGSALWGLTGGVAQTLFSGGALLHQRRAAEAALDQAAAQYRGTVVNAFQNVADTLNALAFDADALRLQSTAQQAAARSLDIAQGSLKLGATSYYSVLVAQQAYQQANLALAQARAGRLTDTVALFQALGGGWWNRGG